MDDIRMQWVECPLLDDDGATLHPPSCSDDEDDDNIIDLLNRREGHCAAILAAGNDDASQPAPSAWVVVCGGYTKGSFSAVPLVAPTSLLPALQWCALPEVDEFECDGASLTTLGAAPCFAPAALRTASPGEGDAVHGLETPAASSSSIDNTVAYLFGGFNSEMDLRNNLYAVTLCEERDGSGAGAADAWVPTAVSVTEVHTTGNIPAPRARHGAGGMGDRLFIFGGETATQEQTCDLYVCDVRTGVWRAVSASSSSPHPAPRLLTLSLVFVTPVSFVLYGGSHFFDGAVQSFADVWRFDAEKEEWAQLVAAADDVAEDGTSSVLPRSNGHAGGAVVVTVPTADSAQRLTCAVFVGGKDISEGDDRIKLVGCTTGEGSGAATAVRVRPALPAAETGTFPHWRYTPAVVTNDKGLLLLAGQCRHAQVPSSFLLTFA